MTGSLPHIIVLLLIQLQFHGVVKNNRVLLILTREAEYMAATNVAQERIWLKWMIGDIYNKVDYAILIQCDNESAIRMATNMVFHARTKRIEIQQISFVKRCLNRKYS